MIKYGGRNWPHYQAIDCCLRSFHVSTGLVNTLLAWVLGLAPIWGKFLSFASKYSSSSKFGLNFSSKWILIQDTYKNCSLKSNVTRRLFSGNCSKTQQISRGVKRGESWCQSDSWEGQSGRDSEKTIPCHLNIQQRSDLAQRKKGAGRTWRESHFRETLPKRIAMCFWEF